MYTIAIDKVIFRNVLEYIYRTDIYEIIAYMLPIVLATNVLIILGGNLSIVPVANNIM